MALSSIIQNPGGVPVDTFVRNANGSVQGITIPPAGTITVSSITAQMQNQLLKYEHFSVIEYARHLKTGGKTEGFEGFSHQYIKRSFENFSIENFLHKPNNFEKWVPANSKDEYIFVTKETSSFDQKSRSLFYTVVAIQFALLVFFALLSFFLAQNALAPLRENMEKLDRFAKDLIHDLNTPVTSIGLNIRALGKEQGLKNQKALMRLQKSADDISNLHKNLTFLLHKKSSPTEKADLKAVIESLLDDYRHLYPNLLFFADGIKGEIFSNPSALRQILDNLLSNACKYSRDGGKIAISFEHGTLSIHDEGVGIKEPRRIFERNYTEHLHSSGIGLDIVKRLCEAMHIGIEVESSEKGTFVALTFS